MLVFIIDFSDNIYLKKNSSNLMKKLLIKLELKLISSVFLLPPL